MHHDCSDANDHCLYQRDKHHKISFLRQIQQYPLTHNVSSSSITAAPLLSPRVHSMLYHSTMGRGGSLLLSQQGDASDTMSLNKSLSFSAAASVHSSNHTRQLQQQQEKRQLPRSEAAGSLQVKRCGAAANAATVAPVVSFFGGSGVAYSPYSANTSLGNGSGSPSTTRGLRTTETKKRLHDFSPTSCLPFFSPPKSRSIATGGIAGGALEELLAADKEELVQILLELSSCNQEVAHFIESKAQLFFLRKSALPGVERSKSSCEGGICGVGGDTSAKATGAAASVVAQSERRNVGLGIADRCCSSAEATPSKPLAFEDDSFFLNSCNKTVSALDVSSRRTSLCNSHHTSALVFTPLSKCAMEKQQNVGNVMCSDVDAHVSADERQWSNETHPCLRLYGSCRHNKNCLFASSPQNLCLNWVRNSCVAGKRCKGVHRLPDVCSKNVRTLYELSHSANNDVVTYAKLHRKDKQWAVTNNITEFSLRKSDSKVTPRGQIFVNPVSIPASLEHYHHVLRLGDGDHSATNSALKNKDDDRNKNDYNQTTCNCRGCSAWSNSDDVDWDIQSQNHDVSEHLRPLRLPLPRPVPRCLNDSFAAATGANEKHENSSDGDEWVCWANTMSSALACEEAAACLADSDDDGVDLPPCNALTRTQSPTTL